ncbi:MAG: AraC family ligand binding domain-containing protein [Planctomycetes bacterium]|nr:AraC family ligand binding domain-containing protein [Planctomycetota bacterium]
MEEQSHERLREHPSSRFAAPQHRFDLEVVAGVLGQETQAGEAGHRQQTLYKHGGTTVALFLFGHLSHLAPHRTKGTVVIHVLRGHLRVTAERETHDLRSGQMLVLACGVEHGIVAPEESTMLLTVHLEPLAATSADPNAAPAQLAMEPGLRPALARWDNEGGHPSSIESSSGATLAEAKPGTLSGRTEPLTGRSLGGERACPGAT